MNYCCNDIQVYLAQKKKNTKLSIILSAIGILSYTVLQEFDIRQIEKWYQDTEETHLLKLQSGVVLIRRLGRRPFHSGRGSWRGRFRYLLILPNNIHALI